ncbi:MULTISPECIES: hypothetical protein [unclassified Tenacibaculum]|uniref:DUF7674 family protein n=1 Tax=unclassified Tenacibaculum TaxID=2635139 RepID=UPI001F2B901C|nr:MULTISPECIES: hypothetical protein [unclassified Tenacibaculum]MCF2875188.1 hypothetical protein [Tenacibaculum sp. Cn5-1]MCF2935264.1 hypothetical protein [Tenacibaculum sp. Cn5-34]MCG7511294.1 hypothetical protein [Tenacibaculum sp. Cn5-46]
MKKTDIIFQESEVELVFQKLISDWNELTDFYNKEVKFNYKDPSDRLAYSDIADISRFIVDKKKSGQTENFENFFKNVEELMIFGDDYVKNLIVVGLFEGIQNIGGSEIDYYKSFDKWLKKNSLKAWRDLINSWEDLDWKKTN